MIKNYNQNELTRHFTVTNPIKQGDNIVYLVSGRSPFNKGEKFAVERRF